MLVVALGLLLGAFGVFVALLVTASMIPHTFEAGSVDLLLSKPITRSGVFLAKFFGGCAFIAINAAYFITGLWLILGLRLGLWNERMLWAIPLYVFLFAIYYGVSALAGLIWRNAIVSVVLAVVFWLVCFVLGTAVGYVEQLSLDPQRLVHIVPAGETLVVANQSQIFTWDAADRDWDPIMVPRGRQEFSFAWQLVGPVYDPQGDRLLALRAAPGFEGFGSVNRLLIGARADGWRRTEGVTLPGGAADLFVTAKGEVLVAGPTGVFRLQGDVAAKQQDINFFGFHVPLPELRGGFVPAGSQTRLRPLQSSACDAASGAMLLFDGTQMVLCQVDDSGKYDVAGEVKLDRRASGRVALGGGRAYLALGGGEVRRYGPKLEVLKPVDSGINSVPISAAVSPDGRYLAVVFKNARLWLYDTRDDAPVPLSVRGQGDVSAATFAGDKLLVADRLTRVSEYDLAERKLTKGWQPPMSTLEKIYRYGLYPLYKIFPKPGELNDTVSYVLTAEDTKIAGPRFDDRRQNVPTKVDIWGPVWSNLAFLAVVLAISCWHVSRKDF